MNVVQTLLVRDEADIIACNLDYHLSRGVDLILITDNGSTDGTREILTSYERSGRVFVRDQEPSDFSQGKWVSQMAEIAYAEHQADWVIHGDADEFFLPAENHQHNTLKEVLQDVPSDIDILHVPRHDFVPIHREEKAPPPIEMVYRKQFSTTTRGAPLPPKVIHRGVADVTISQGNHSAESPDLNHQALDTSDLTLFHYPIRSFKQFSSKVRNAGSGYAQNQDLPEGIGFHKRYWYQLLKEGELEKEFEKHFWSTSQIEAGLHSGELIIDRALSDHIRSA